MATHNKLDNDSSGPGTEAFTGHWQPALRPDVLHSSAINLPTTTSGPEAEVPLSRAPEGDSSSPASIEPAPSSSALAPNSTPWPESHSPEEQSHAYQRPDGLEEIATSLKPSQESLKSPLVGLSWSSGLQGFGDNDAELESDEDDERLDPAWGITRTDTAQILQKVNRSSSFPEFEPQISSSSPPAATQLSYSQVDEIMQEQENLDSREGNFGKETIYEHTIASQEETDTEFPSRDEFNKQLQADAGARDESMESKESQSRYEEGLPLISSEPEQKALLGEQAAEPRSLVTVFDESTAQDEASFFDNVSSSTPALSARPPQLDRKATSDVLESLHFSESAPLDSPVRQETFDQFQTEDDSALDFSKLTAGGVLEAEDDSTLDFSKLAAGKALEAEDDDLLDFSKLAPGGAPEVEDEDAMWKAALADDEFLVEDPDDLLPESPPDSPSSFPQPLKDDTGSVSRQSASNPALTTTPKRESRPDPTRQSSSNPFAPHQPSTSDLTQLSPTTYANLGLTRPGLAPMNSFQQHLQQRPAAQSTQSFADQSKGGYKSPYDLPLELAKPRKRAQAPLPSPALKGGLPPPPRSSSMSSDQQLQSPFTPTNGSFPNLGSVPSATIASPPAQRKASVASPPQPALSAKPSSSAFFEELPMTSRPRPPTGQGRYTPQQNSPMPPPSLLPRSPPSRQTSHSEAYPQPPPPTNPDPYAQYQLRPPERMDPYANVPLQVPAPAIPAVTSMRYSPAPVTSQLGPKPSSSPRYSPAPPSQTSSTGSAGRYASQTAQPSGSLPGNMPPPNRYASQPAAIPPVSNLQPFQPRTSSPLAYHGKPSTEQPRQAVATADRSIQNSNLPDSTAGAVRPTASTFSPPVSAFIPPQRSQTQSPGKIGQLASFPTLTDDNVYRPASVQSQMPMLNNSPRFEMIPPARPSVRQRGLTQNFDFIEPTDGQELDVLKRWKGAPIFRFGFGGTTLSCFPRHVPRYSAGSASPMIKPSAGEVVLRTSKDILPLPDLTASFPGPLRSKSKKKEVLAWMTSYIAALEQKHSLQGISQQLPDPQKCHEEKILLWKIVRALVEHDGVLETGVDARKTVNQILNSEIFALDESAATQYRESGDLNGIYRPSGSSARADPVDPVAVENLRRSLLRGEREKAVWGAVDNRLWAHALLVSSTLDRTVWKQVVQEFVRQEVKVIGANTESLAALYEIFAGNLEESIDELVPPSARAGLQMVSRVDNAGPTKNALDGLDRWRETLSLVLNNRSPEDIQAVAALARLLASYGRVEAAHICFIFSRGPSQPTIFGGADDLQSNVVLLGVDHQARPLTFFNDDDAILLTEVYEFATNVLATGSMASSLPHLQVYKLRRAISLAESGHKNDAQAYCDGITGSWKSNTKISPYFNQILFAELEELSSRLKQAPVQSSSSWIAKPSIEKVSGSVWNKFSSFVAGDDSDADSKGSGKDVNHELGPFAKVTGTPSLSRSGSSSDLYGSYPTNVPAPVPNTTAGSRYAPNGLQTARSSSELTRGRASLDSQRSPPSTSMGQAQRPGSFEPPSSFGQYGYVPQATNNLYQSMSQSPPTSRYGQTPPQTSYMSGHSLQGSPQHSTPLRQPDSYIPTPPPEQMQTSYMPSPPPVAEPVPPPAEYPSFGNYSPAQPAEISSFPSQPATTSNTSYDPPAQSYGYEPPSDPGYVPYEPEPESDPESDTQKLKAPKKKSFMDEDEDDFPRGSNGTSTGPPPPSSTHTATNTDPNSESRKRENDAKADAAFRAAAEADAAREKEAKAKAKGWGLGGWFGGKKGDSLDANPGPKGAEPKVHKAKLGESKMTLYYDKDLKKWVDPNNPDSLKQKASTPPPPKMGGPARGLTPSASMPSFHGSGPSAGGPPSGPPSRVGTPGDGPAPGGPPMLQRPESSGLSGPPSGPGTPPPAGLGGGVAPPSRPTTGMSNASSIDDLLGPMGGAAGGRRTIKGKKGAKRYIDVMAQ